MTSEKKPTPEEQVPMLEAVCDALRARIAELERERDEWIETAEIAAMWAEENTVIRRWARAWKRAAANARFMCREGVRLEIALKAKLGAALARVEALEGALRSVVEAVGPCEVVQRGTPGVYTCVEHGNETWTDEGTACGIGRVATAARAALAEPDVGTKPEKETKDV